MVDDDEIKLIEFKIVVGDDTITAAYVDPGKIAGMLAEEKSLGGFLWEMLFAPHEEVEERPEVPEIPARPMTEREIAMVNGFENLVDTMGTTPEEVRAMISGIVAGFAHRSGVPLEDLHADIDAAYAYKMAHTGRPS